MLTAGSPGSRIDNVTQCGVTPARCSAEAPWVAGGGEGLGRGIYSRRQRTSGASLFVVDVFIGILLGEVAGSGERFVRLVRLAEVPQGLLQDLEHGDQQVRPLRGIQGMQELQGVCRSSQAVNCLVLMPKLCVHRAEADQRKRVTLLGPYVVGGAIGQRAEGVDRLGVVANGVLRPARSAKSIPETFLRCRDFLEDLGVYCRLAGDQFRIRVDRLLPLVHYFIEVAKLFLHPGEAAQRLGEIFRDRTVVRCLLGRPTIGADGFGH